MDRLIRGYPPVHRALDAGDPVLNGAESPKPQDAVADAGGEFRVAFVRVSARLRLRPINRRKRLPWLSRAAYLACESSDPALPQWWS